MPYTIFLLLLPSLVYLPLLTCTYLYIYNTQYSINTSGVNITLDLYFIIFSSFYYVIMLLCTVYSAAQCVCVHIYIYIYI